MAFGAHHDMKCSTSDVKQAYPYHYRWDDPECKNPRRVYTRLSAFQSGTGKEENLEFLTATNGFRDASAMFEGVNARMIFNWGAMRSVVHRGLFYRHMGTESLMIVGAYVDHSCELRTQDEGGTKMLEELAIAREAAGFQMKVQQLDDHPEGIDFAGRLITPFKNKYGKGFALTQPNMHAKITEYLKELGVDMSEAVHWLPVSPEWTPLVAAQGLKAGTDRCSTTTYLQLLGLLLWTKQTAPRSAMESILGSYSRHPGMTELWCLITAAQHFLSTSHIPLMFYTNPEALSISVPVAQHAYVDAGEVGETDGGGRKSIIIKLGLLGTPSGGILTATNKVQHSNSTPADEAEALVDAIGRLRITRALSEDFAGLRGDIYDTSEMIEGSPAATHIYIKPEVADSVNSNETDDTHCIVRTQSVAHLQQKKVHIATPPSEVYEDNEIVVKISNADGAMQLKGLRGSLRVFGAIHSAIKDKVMKVIKIPSADNHSNQLSKIPSSPLAHALSLEGMVGKSDEMDEFRLQAIRKFGKSPRSGPGTLEIPQSVVAFAGMPLWTHSVSQDVTKLLHKTGFIAAQLCQDSVIEDELSYKKAKPGIGYFAAAASPTPTTYEKNYSSIYVTYNFPDPQSDSTVERDYWDSLVRKNTEQNANMSDTEYFERTIAANATMQIQISTVTCLRELEELENDQRLLTARIAVYRASLAKRGVEQGNREMLQDKMVLYAARKCAEQRYAPFGVQFVPRGDSEESDQCKETASGSKDRRLHK
jgi:hypothetical protein